MFVCCECCVLSGRCLWDELITRPEESYRLWCVAVCDLETSRMWRPWPALGRRTRIFSLQVLKKGKNELCSSMHITTQKMLILRSLLQCVVHRSGTLNCISTSRVLTLLRRMEN